MNADRLIQLHNLRVVFDIGGHQRTVIDDIDYVLHRGEILGIVGESGSGKTQSAFSILGIENGKPGIVGGDISITLDHSGEAYSIGELVDSVVSKSKTGTQLLYRKNEHKWKKNIRKFHREIRGKRIFLMFQDPRSYLNPFWTIEKHFQRVVPPEIQARENIDHIIETSLRKFGLSDYRRVASCYPHELSGGMNQRVMIALGYACKPDVIIADEITTGLDVVNQKMVVSHLKRLMNMSDENSGRRLPGIIVISHDLGFISKLADTIFVMYAGQGVEFGDADIILNPKVKRKHPYSRELVEIYLHSHRKGYIEGDPPKLDNPPSGCRFHERCHVFKSNGKLGCDTNPPEDFGDLTEKKHQIRCRLYE